MARADVTAWTERALGVRAGCARRGVRVQSLWGGYGEVVRVFIHSDSEVGDGGDDSGGSARDAASPPRLPPAASVIVKIVDPPAPPGASSPSLSHARKLRSYDVEQCFYEAYAPRCRRESCRVARFIAGTRPGSDSSGAGSSSSSSSSRSWRFLMEDLDAAGFDGRRHSFGGRDGCLTRADVRGCLSWLAAFHAEFMGVEPHGLWPVGTYWHLGTRPDELAAVVQLAKRGAYDDAGWMGGGACALALRLHSAASAIDARLSSLAERYRTLVHGDAKAANFCFRSGGDNDDDDDDDDDDRTVVAAVDFQYCGGGVGMKDVVYLLSCLDDATLERHAGAHLDYYFDALRSALAERRARDGGGGVSLAECAALESAWRALYACCWADWMRFLAGWGPEYFLETRYGRAMAKRALDELDAG